MTTSRRPPSTPLATDDLLAIKDALVPRVRDLGRWAQDLSERGSRGEADLDVQLKTGAGDVVTFADREVQRRLAEALRIEHPTFGFLGEEGLDDRQGQAPTWVIDPIDGTHNFVRRYPGFCVSVGLVVDGEPVLGVIYDSVGDDVCWAVAGAGAWRDDVRLRLTAPRELGQALVTTNFVPASNDDEVRRALFWDVARRAAGVRASGSACRDLCLIASGRLDLFWQFGLYAWDVAAGAVIVREAGGVMAFANEPADWLRAPGLSVFAGGRELVAEVRALSPDAG